MTVWTDQERLLVLWLVEDNGLSFLQAARIMTADTGRRITRSAVSGIVKRINDDADKYDADGNQNGTMPPQWWRQ